MTSEDPAVDTAAQQELTGAASLLGDGVRPDDFAGDAPSDRDAGEGAPRTAPSAADALGDAATDSEQPVTQGP